MVITILDFKAEGKVSSGILRSAYKTLEVELIKTNRFSISAVERRDDIMKEAKYQYSGVCASECLVDIGKQLSADFLINGEIVDIGDEYHVIISIIDIEKATFYDAVETFTGRKSKEIIIGIKVLALEITREISLKEVSQSLTNDQNFVQTEIKKTYGIVNIKSDPPGADILIDQNIRGVTPIILEKIETGARNVILNYPGYEKLQKRIMVNEGETVIISEYLVPKTGNLSILSEPSGATIYLDNSVQGKTPMDIFDLNIRDYIVRLELKDYQTIERRVTVEYSENTTQKYNLDPLPGKLTLFTSPQNANIAIGGKKYISESNGIVTIELPVGRYKMEISKKGYESFKEEVFITANYLGTRDINLKKLPAGVSSNPNMGFLTVNTLDGKIKLKIQGVKDPQRLPLKYFELKHGTYGLKAYGDGLESKKESVVINKQKTSTIEINLKRKKKAKALRYSLMFPGAGQIYEGSRRGLLYSSLTLGSGVLLANTLTSYFDDKNLLNQYKNNYQSATLSSEIDSAWELYEYQSNKVNDSQNTLMFLGSTLVSTWLTGIIDSFLFSNLK